MKKQIEYKGLLGETNPLLRYPQLYDAAVDEFSHRKFEDASLNDILKKVGMSKGSFYHHFGDKFGLYLCMMDRVIQKKISFFVPFMQANKDNGDFFGTIKQVVRATMEFMFLDERLHHLFNRNFEALDDLKGKLLEYFQYDYTQGFGPMIQVAIQSGQIDSRFSPEFIAKMLEILFSNVHKLLTSSSHSVEEIAKIIDQMMDMMQYGIAPKKGEDS